MTTLAENFERLEEAIALAVSEARSHEARLTDEDRAEGHSLACQPEINGNLPLDP